MKKKHSKQASRAAGDAEVKALHAAFGDHFERAAAEVAAMEAEFGIEFLKPLSVGAIAADLADDHRREERTRRSAKARESLAAKRAQEDARLRKEAKRMRRTRGSTVRAIAKHLGIDRSRVARLLKT